MPDYGGGQTKVIHDSRESKQLCRESAKKPDELITHLQYETTAKWHWNLSVKSPKEMSMLQRSPGSPCLGNTHHRALLRSAGKQQHWKQLSITGKLRRYSWSEIISFSWVTGRSKSLQGSLLRGSDASEMPPTEDQKPLCWPIENCNRQSQEPTAKKTELKGRLSRNPEDISVCQPWLPIFWKYQYLQPHLSFADQ